MAARGAAFEDRHLAIVAWAFGQLGHVPAPAARAPLLAQVEARLAGMAGRSLATLAAGLSAVEQQRRWRERQRRRQQLELEASDAEEEPAAAPAPAAGGSSAAGADAPLVPQPLVEAMAARAAALAPRLQPFELAQLVTSLAVLGSEGAPSAFLRAPSPDVAVQVQAAADRAPLPAAVGLLWAMAHWRCYPPHVFASVASRLHSAHRNYRLPQPALAMLGEALQAMDPERRSAVRLRRGLAYAAVATARAAELRGPCGTLLAPGSGAGSGSDASDGEAALPLSEDAAAPPPDSDDEPWQAGAGDAWRSETFGGGEGPAAQAPSADNANAEEDWLSMTYDDLEAAMGRRP